MQKNTTPVLMTASDPSEEEKRIAAHDFQVLEALEAQAHDAMRKMNEMQRWRWALRGIVIQ